MTDDYSGDLRMIDEETENAVSTAISRYQAFLNESDKAYSRQIEKSGVWITRFSTGLKHKSVSNEGCRQ